MLNRETIKQWRQQVPWREAQQVEQDLLLEAVLHTWVKAEEALDNFVLIGGTCLHKFHIDKQQGRYSEDIDVTYTGDIKRLWDVLHSIRDCLGDLDFEEIEVIPPDSARFPKLLLYFTNINGGKRKIKFEINTGLADVLRGEQVMLPLYTDSDWMRQQSLIPCAPLPSIAAMKVLALGDRVKPRDFYDLWVMREQLGVLHSDLEWWFRRMSPSDLKLPRRHRAVKRRLHKGVDWGELENTLPQGTMLDKTIKADMGNLALNTLHRLQPQNTAQ
ncbi:nucleotidyl transferase AbiEii/AbiGii toxin family protein [Candidatus Poriferisocius sp.]|uniref:nucleotidyl transferase AbiEii/AbiGii toxin family protein n=1 Tax=Candidatus Poriferisocius sp. TaxID=3101276 RepID=UPI003B01E76C